MTVVTRPYTQSIRTHILITGSMLHERRRTWIVYYVAVVLLLFCLQRLDINDGRSYVGVTAIPLFLVDSSTASCYDIDAIQDTIIKIYYKAPHVEFDDSHPTSTEAYISISTRPHHRVYDTDLHHAPVRDRLKPLVHRVLKNEGTLFHRMEIDGTAKVCVRATDSDKGADYSMVFGLRLSTSDEEPELLRKLDSDNAPTTDLDGHLSHVEMELKRITMAMDTVLKEASRNQEQDTKFHKQTLAMHSAITFWPMLQVCVLLMTGFTQTSHIIHFFKSRRII